MRFDFSFLPSSSRRKVEAMPSVAPAASSSSSSMMRKPVYSSPKRGSSGSPSAARRRDSSNSSSSVTASPAAVADLPASLSAFLLVRADKGERLENEEQLEAALQHAGWKTLRYMGYLLTKHAVATFCTG